MKAKELKTFEVYLEKEDTPADYAGVILFDCELDLWKFKPVLCELSISDLRDVIRIMEDLK